MAKEGKAGAEWIDGGPKAYRLEGWKRGGKEEEGEGTEQRLEEGGVIEWEKEQLASAWVR